MKLLCEIDYFCKVVLEPNERTGVFNTMRDILTEISKRKDVDLTFCSYQYPISFFNKQFVKMYPEFRGIKSFWMGTFKSKTIYFFQATAYKFRQKYKKNKKIYYKILYILCKLLRGMGKVFIDTKYFVNKKISEYDYYLSLSKPIPKFVGKNKNIKTAIFIHDLIPIKFPEYFSINEKTKKEKTLKKFGEIFSSITKNTVILCNSEYTKKDLIEVYPKFKNNKIAVVYLGANKEKFFYIKDREKKNSKSFQNIQKTLRKYKIPTDKPYFLSLTSMNPRKNTSFVIEGFLEFLEKTSSNVNLVLAGKFDWNCGDILKKLKENQKYTNNIIVTGFVDEKDVNNIYNGAVGFVYLSLYEGFGMPVLEAMQCGSSVITSNTTSLPEVVGDAGVLIDPLNSQDLVANLLKIYKDKKFRQGLIKKSLKKADFFNWKKTADKILEALS